MTRESRNIIMATKTTRKGGKVVRTAENLETVAYCVSDECDWETTAGNAMPQAKLHAQKNKHRVVSIVRTKAIFDGSQR